MSKYNEINIEKAFEKSINSAKDKGLEIKADFNGDNMMTFKKYFDMDFYVDEVHRDYCKLKLDNTISLKYSSGLKSLNEINEAVMNVEELVDENGKYGTIKKEMFVAPDIGLSELLYNIELKCESIDSNSTSDFVPQAA